MMIIHHHKSLFTFIFLSWCFIWFLILSLISIFVCRAPRVLHKAACSKYLDEIASRSTFASIFFSAVYQLMLDVDGKRRWLNMSSHVAATTDATSGLNAVRGRTAGRLPNTGI